MSWVEGRLVGRMHRAQAALACGQAVACGEQVGGGLVLRDDAAALVHEDDRERQPVAQGLVGPALRLEPSEAGLQPQRAKQMGRETIENHEIVDLERTAAPRALSRDAGQPLPIVLEDGSTDIAEVQRH